MKSTLKQLFGILLLVGSVGFTAACGDDGDADPCTTNQDCTSGVCDKTNQVCLGKACTDSTDCAGEAATPVCGAAPASVANEFPMICIAGGGDGLCDTQMDPTAFCEAELTGSFCIGMECKVPANCAEVPAANQAAFCTSQLGSAGTCSAGVCVSDTVPKVAKFVRIVDTTPGCGPSETNGASDAGSDISIVELLRGGSVVGSAQFPGAGAYMPGGNSPGYTNATGVFDGMPEAVGERGCPMEDADQKYFRQDTVVSLGCGGSIVLGFAMSGTEVNLANNDEVRVVELGKYCETVNAVDNYGTDRYRVDLCITNADASRFADIDLERFVWQSLLVVLRKLAPSNFGVSGMCLLAVITPTSG